MTRTEFLIQNPRLITALGSRSGIPFRELDDFAQEVLMASVRRKDRYNPRQSSLSTYASILIKWVARDYLRNMKKNPRCTSYSEEIDSDDED